MNSAYVVLTTAFAFTLNEITQCLLSRKRLMIFKTCSPCVVLTITLTLNEITRRPLNRNRFLKLPDYGQSLCGMDYNLCLYA